MSRRILLVDNDRVFNSLLVEQLGPYGIEIVVASPADPDVLAKVTQLEPLVVIIAVDEPDKVGYSLCNKAKKGVAANVPVILATSTVTPAGFAGHRKLKIHADEYVDKRGLNPAELVGKIDNLVGLGEPVHGDELQIPVEVEDLPLDLADAEMVEQLEDVSDFDAEVAHTAIAPPKVMDSLMDADLDGAFAAITDFSDEAISPPGPPGPPAAHAAHPPQPTSDYVVTEASMGVPEPIDPPSQDELEAAEVPAGEWAAGEIPEPIDPSDFGAEEATSADLPIAAMQSVAAAHVAHVVAPKMSAPEPLPEPEPEPELEQISLSQIELPEAEPEAPPPPAAVPIHVVSAPSEGIDLGLDAVAESARSEQSGVHDRRTLQKLHLLERENQKLKADLDKAKVSGEGGKMQGREREFLHLREMIATKDKEILELRDELVVKDRQILDGKEKIRQLSHTKVQLEGKNLELEQRIVGESDRNESGESARKELEVRNADLTARLTAVEAKTKTDAEAAARALADKTASAASLDKELIAARARITEAEARHAESIAQLTRSRDAAEAKLRGELEKAQDEALAGLREQLSRSHGDRLAALAAEHAGLLAEKEREQSTALSAVVAHHEERHAEMASALEAALAASREDAARALETAKAEHEARMVAAAAAHADALAAESARASKAAADAETSMRDITAAERARADKAIAEASARAQDDMVAVIAAHQSEGEKLAGEHKSALDALRAEHDTKLAQSRAAAIADRDRLESEHATAVAVLTEDRDQAQAAVTTARAELDKARTDMAALADRAQRDLAAAVGEVRTEKAEVEKGLSAARERIKGLEEDLAQKRETVHAREREVETQAAAVAERDQRIAALRTEIEELEKENAGYQEQVLKAYQKIKNDENTVTRAKKAMAIALTLLDEEKKKGAQDGE